MVCRFKQSIVTILLLVLLPMANAQAGWFSSLFGSKETAKTKYPIVTVGGFLAFDSIFGAEYFYGIADDLRRNGATVYESDVSEFQSNEVRGEELIKEIEDYLALTGAGKVNLFAHSQGAPTARYVAAVRPDLVASVTSIHGMNRGTPLADVVRKVMPEGGIAEALLDALTMNVGGPLFALLSGDKHVEPQSSIAVLDSYNTEDARQFNQRYSAAMPGGECGTYGDHVVNGVRYWSWGGIGGYTGSVTNPFDMLDIALLNITPLMFPNRMKHDGFVPLCGQYLGKPIRHSYRHNHFDAQRQLFGVTGFEVDPKTLYRNQANRLKKAGL